MNPFRVFPHPTFDRVNKLEEQWCRDSFSLSSRDSTTRLINDDQLANERGEKIKSGENLHGLLSLFGKTTTTTTTTWTIELCSSVKQRCRWNDLRSTNRTRAPRSRTPHRVRIEPQFQRIIGTGRGQWGPRRHVLRHVSPLSTLF